MRATISVFFFFQAEDGMRYLTVTGVQTCALPFSPPPPAGYTAVVHGFRPSPAWTQDRNFTSTRFWRLDPGNYEVQTDRKSTRLNSSHSQISYAVFCLKKKKTESR